MSAVGDCYEYLSTYAGLTALIGQNLHRVRAPQGTKPPYCVISRIIPVRHYTHQGYAGLQDVHLQVSCYSLDEDECEQIADQVIAAIEAWPKAGNPYIQDAFIDGAPTLYDPDVSDAFHIPIDIRVGYGV
jgi:hypothetical protein